MDGVSEIRNYEDSWTSKSNLQKSLRSTALRPFRSVYEAGGSNDFNENLKSYNQLNSA